MSFGELLNSIPSNYKDLIRKIETEEKRLISVKLSKLFLENCYLNNHLPKMLIINPSIWTRCNVILLKYKYMD